MTDFSGVSPWGTSRKIFLIFSEIVRGWRDPGAGLSPWVWSREGSPDRSRGVGAAGRRGPGRADRTGADAGVGLDSPTYTGSDRRAMAGSRPGRAGQGPVGHRLNTSPGERLIARRRLRTEKRGRDGIP